MRTWKPAAAGVLELIAGSFQIVGGAALILFSGAVAAGLPFCWPNMMGPELPVPLIAGVGLPMVLLGIVAIVGGIVALKRRAWGLALAGGICALFPPYTLLGIVAIVFVALSKDEF